MEIYIGLFPELILEYQLKLLFGYDIQGRLLILCH